MTVTERVILVSPRGLCAGVVRAVTTVERALAVYAPPVYVRRAIVHNAHVVARLAAAFGKALALDAEEQDVVVRAAELHDIGKVAIPDAILHKGADLTTEEWELMRKHTIIGQRILDAAPALQPVANLIRSTHERWDGTGYPDRLVGDEIPLAARVFSVADTLDALTTDRPYRPASNWRDARIEIRKFSGTQFDPAVVDAFENIPDEHFARLRGAL